MKRRVLLSLATLGVIPMTFNKSLAGTIVSSQGIDNDKNNYSNQLQSIPRFGDGRDWFFEKRFGMFMSANILRRISGFIKPAKESLFSVEVVSELIKDATASYTQLRKNLYIHFNAGCNTNGYSLEPLTRYAFENTLLDDGSIIKCVLTESSNDFKEEKEYLRLQNLPVNEFTNTVMVVRLEFDTVVAG